MSFCLITNINNSKTRNLCLVKSVHLDICKNKITTILDHETYAWTFVIANNKFYNTIHISPDLSL